MFLGFDQASLYVGLDMALVGFFVHKWGFCV